MRIGILGGGQLGRMLALAAHELGVQPVVFAQGPGPATEVAGTSVTAPWSDATALRGFAASVDVVTYELEQLPLAAVAAVAAVRPVYPPPKALEAMQDRLLERELLGRVGLPHAAFVPFEGPADMPAIETKVGYPSVIKGRRGGYDGKAQWRLGSRADLMRLAADVSEPAICERWVDWRGEYSLVCVRNAAGDVRFYPLTMNHHEGGVLRWSKAPAPGVTADAEAEAQRMAKALLEATDYVGVLAIELFDTPDGWLINELAPRVHNSGHWTQDGAVTSQFENHVRAIAGLPLGATDARGHSLMVNILGEEPPLEALLAVPGARAHRYRKSAAPGRKLAHVNVCAETAEARDAALEQLGPLLGVHPA